MTSLGFGEMVKGDSADIFQHHYSLNFQSLKVKNYFILLFRMWLGYPERCHNQWLIFVLGYFVFVLFVRGRLNWVYSSSIWKRLGCLPFTKKLRSSFIWRRKIEAIILLKKKIDVFFHLKNNWGRLTFTRILRSSYIWRKRIRSSFIYKKKEVVFHMQNN